MIKQTIVAIAIMMMLSAGIVFAEETIEQSDVDLQADAGLTPDSALYGIDLALEKLSLALAKDNFARAKIAMQQAKEHLAEARLMAKKEKLEARDKALKAHDERVADADAHKNGLSEEHRAEVEANMRKHVDVLKGVQAKLELKGVPAASKGVANAIENSQKALENVRSAKSAEAPQGIKQNINSVQAPMPVQSQGGQGQSRP